MTCGVAMLAVLLVAAAELGLVNGGSSTTGAWIGVPLLICAVVLVASFVVWIGALLNRTIGIAKAKPHDRPARKAAFGGQAWLAFPAVIVLTAGVLAVLRPLVWTLHTEPRLEDRFVNTQAGDLPSTLASWTETSDQPGSIGRFTISEVWRAGTNVAILDPTEGFVFSRGGIAYLPDGSGELPDWPWGGSQPQFSPLDDGWYSWTQTF